MKTPGHRIIIDGPPGALHLQTWRCECGKWESRVPALGPYGSATAKARIAQVQMAHGKHVRGVLDRARKAAQS